MDRKRLVRSPILWIAVAVILLFALPQMLSGGSSYKGVKTSEALSQITSGNVKTAIIHDKESRVELDLKTPYNGKSKISASYPADFTQTLTNDLLKSNGAVTDTKQSKENALVSILLSLLPILLIAFVLFFVMSNLQGGGSKVMSF
ncbi:ATP-dependent metallopeptidase FtsH/Yme1/Tma family protein, partial [Jatrophihabitans sp.]|uniref:ATP-dependent metallopeptidase FtsH/Yme1/Tma family protein n=1 Tax=Jatrophihabitans sp. TaxID=1932789 RepID=UPI002C27841B|nr:ATP-dependent metallopeptidase FtsH/Yme1/Tma family protein [Jatrophihabitans sp.]